MQDDEKPRRASDSNASNEASDSPDTSGATGDEASAVEPGMTVEASKGDLGEHDVSTARVIEVDRDAAGDVTNIVVEKGAVFRKKLDVSPGRVEAVEITATESETATASDGKVILNTTKEEIRRLSATGEESLGPEKAPPQTAQSGIPAGRTFDAADVGAGGDVGDSGDNGSQTADKPSVYLRTLGPGLLSGMAGNDSSAVTSYSINGATNGYGQLWLMLLATPLYQAVQYACAKIGRVTQRGMTDILREHYGQRVAVPASLILVIANIALIAADLVAVGTGIQLLTGLAWQWFVVPVAAGLWYLVVYKNFSVIKRIFLGMSLAFAVYLVTALFSGAKWGAVLQATFVPHISLGFAGVSSAVALLGATVSPYTMYWQVQGEKEEKRPGSHRQQFKLAAVDILTGTISGNLVAFAIIICTSATLFTHHKTIRTAADAASALAPLLGPFAEYLFAFGFIGAGLIAIPVLLASTSYGLSGVFGWSASLWKKPWQSEGFYLIMTGALIVSLVVALLGFNPIDLMFWANVLQGILSPVLIVFLLLVGNNRTIMRTYRLGRFTNLGLVLIALVMTAATLLLFFGLLTGQGG